MHSLKLTLALAFCCVLALFLANESFVQTLAGSELRGSAQIDSVVDATVLRRQALESVWQFREQVLDDDAVLDRLAVYEFLGHDPEFEQKLLVRVREALAFDTVRSSFTRSVKTKSWAAKELRVLSNGQYLLEASLSYAARGHLERYWLHPTAGTGYIHPFFVDSISISGWVYF